MQFVSSAPGSLMIMGEHAVVYGYGAIVTAIPERMQLLASPRAEGFCLTSSIYATFEIIADSQAIIANLRARQPGAGAAYRYFLAVLAVTAQYWQKQGVALSVNFESNIPLHAGYGASGAILVAGLKLMQLWLGLKWDEQQCFRLAKQALHVISGNLGSGADIAASLLESNIYFKTTVQGFEYKLLPAVYPHIICRYLGYKTPTPIVIKQLEQEQQRSMGLYKQLFTMIDTVVQAAVAAITAQDWTRLGQLFDDQQRLMAAIGVVTPLTLATLAALKREGVLGAKISGSGCGDCIIALPPTKASVARSLSAIMGQFLPAEYHIQAEGRAFAPVNIALCKYCGKRDTQLNLPLTDSLSISLGKYGTHTIVSVNSLREHRIYLDGVLLITSDFVKKILSFLQLCCPADIFLDVHTRNMLPTSAGLASSASGFAALALALNELFTWRLSLPQLSILARLGSGSASRSLYQGFVYWQAGWGADGLDSYAYPLAPKLATLRLGILIFSQAEKAYSSRIAMQITMQTSSLFGLWPEQVKITLERLQQALLYEDFSALGAAAETNSLTMHALMQAATPAIVYSTVDTLAAMQRVWQLRQSGLSLYFTQDAGANLVLLFLAADTAAVQANFPHVLVINPWEVA